MVVAIIVVLLALLTPALDKATHSNANNSNALGDERVKPVDIDWSGAAGANYFFIPQVR